MNTKYIIEILKPAIIGFILLALIQILSIKYGPKFGAIVTAFPIGLISIYSFHKLKNKVNFGYDATLTNLLVFITYIIYDILINKNINPDKSILISFFFWIILSVILYYLHIMK